jgi:hypothetical protein
MESILITVMTVMVVTLYILYIRLLRETTEAYKQIQKLNKKNQEEESIVHEMAHALTKVVTTLACDGATPHTIVEDMRAIGILETLRRNSDLVPEAKKIYEAVDFAEAEKKRVEEEKIHFIKCKDYARGKGFPVFVWFGLCDVVY